MSEVPLAQNRIRRRKVCGRNFVPDQHPVVLIISYDKPFSVTLDSGGIIKRPRGGMGVMRSVLVVVVISAGGKTVLSQNHVRGCAIGSRNGVPDQETIQITYLPERTGSARLNRGN
jgi:hypothetical protein